MAGSLLRVLVQHWLRKQPSLHRVVLGERGGYQLLLRCRPRDASCPCPQPRSTHTSTHALRLSLASQVIKVGTSSLIRAEQGSLNLSSLASITETVRDLKAQGFNVIIVSRWGWHPCRPGVGGD